jgi:peptidoglycan/LPS O-acetylase OafA/YrhL
LHTFSLSSAGVTQFDQNAILPISVWLAAVAVIGFAIPMERLRTPSLFYRKIARQLGLMTYPLYLVHQISGAFIIGILFQMGLGRVFSPSVGIGIVVLISWLFARHIEPGMRRRIDLACRTVIDHFTLRYAFQRTQNED